MLNRLRCVNLKRFQSIGETTGGTRRCGIAKVAGGFFPYDDLTSLTEGRQVESTEALITMLEPYMTNERVARIQKIASQRTFSVLPVVEGIYNMGNLAAVCRSADGESCL